MVENPVGLSLDDFSGVGGGYGGYNPDHEFFGYRQSIERPWPPVANPGPLEQPC